MKLQDVIDHFGGLSAAADALGLTRGALWQWGKNGITAERQAYVEIMTGGALRADLPKRPQELQA